MPAKTAFSCVTLIAGWGIALLLNACRYRAPVDPEPLKLDTAVALRVLPGDKGVFLSSTRCPQIDRFYWTCPALFRQIPLYTDSNLALIDRDRVKERHLSEDSVALALPEHYSMVFYKKVSGKHRLELMILPLDRSDEYPEIFRTFFGLTTQKN